MNKLVLSGATNDNAQQYTGRENDGTGLYYYRARYYHPTIAWFMSEDPIGWESGQTNTYQYVYSSPVNLVDPLGLYSFGFDFFFGLGWGLTAGYDPVTCQPFISIRAGVGEAFGISYEPTAGRPGINNGASGGGGFAIGTYVEAGATLSVAGLGGSGSARLGFGRDYGASASWANPLQTGGSYGYAPSGKTGFGLGLSGGLEGTYYGPSKCDCKK